jgi:hypothetical protein
MTFKPDTTFNSSHKMGDARITLEKALAKFPEHNDASDDGKVEHGWSGSFKAKDGTEMRASFWCWKGSLRWGNQVSIWVDKPEYLVEFKRFIEA